MKLELFSKQLEGMEVFRMRLEPLIHRKMASSTNRSVYKAIPPLNSCACRASKVVRWIAVRFLINSRKFEWNIRKGWGGEWEWKMTAERPVKGFISVAFCSRHNYLSQLRRPLSALRLIEPGRDRTAFLIFGKLQFITVHERLAGRIKSQMNHRWKREAFLLGGRRMENRNSRPSLPLSPSHLRIYSAGP